MILSSSKVKYFTEYVKNKPELDKLFEKFNSCNDDWFEVLKVQNTYHDKLFPCFVVYAQHFVEPYIEVSLYENK